ncbi:hypothetical protein IEO21_09069 [Rhodonia placenta]|uniref:Uncharacterized protein n=1 Tax=Rhodonia placenta TaxID=104341 RepID=A0A8H7NUZ7_9APHY|nr:hypothetical protein IEO21_09069 [Postia placenta]
MASTSPAAMKIPPSSCGIPPPEVASRS